MSAGHPVAGDLVVEVDRLRRRVAELESAQTGRWMPAAHPQGHEGSERFELDAERILDLSGVMFVALDAHGRVALVNRTACQILERSEAELVGSSWFDTCLPADVRERVRETFHRIVGGELIALEYYENPVLTRSGATRLVAWHNAVLTDTAGRTVGTLSSGLDITEHRRAVQALEESEERFRTLFDHAQDGLLVADAETRRLVMGNQAIQTMLGYPLEELLELTVDDIHPPPDLPRVVAAFEHQVRRELTVARDLPVRRKDGTVLRADISSGPVTLNGRLCLIGVFHDLTEQKQDEEARLALEAKVREAQRLESLGLLAGGVAHDFNNLLVSILGNADLTLAELPPESPVGERLSGILTAANRAAELCGQLLAYSGRGRVVLDDVDLSALVREMGELLEVGAGGRTRLVYDLEPDLPRTRAASTQLRQVVMNLITNAAEASHHAGGVVTVRTGRRWCDRPTLAATYVDDGLPEGEYLLLEVTDSGCGLDRQTLERVFEPFYSTKGPGRGLGLAAALGIIRSHRGAIGIDTEPGSGSRFTVLLPASHGPSLATATAETMPGAAWKGSGRVLLADDEEAVRDVCRQMLEGLGFEVSEASDGQEALDLVRLDPASFRCVVLDLSMPRMDGETALRQLRAARPDLPVLLASGYTLPPSLSAAPPDRPFAFIQKPYRSQDLAAKLRSLLEP